MLLNPEYLLAVFLIFSRIGGVFVAAPFFSHPAIQVRLRIFIAVLMAWVLVALIPVSLPPFALTPVGVVLCVFIEVLTGTLLGFTCRIIFWMVQFFAQTIGFQMGLSLAQAFNPMEGTSTTPLGRLLSIVMIIMFLLLDGHHHILQGLVFSFHGIPLAGANVSGGAELLLGWMGALFMSALQLCAPFMVTFFLLESCLGIFARVVPQADLFSISLPLKLLLGLILFGIFMSDFFPILPNLFDGMAIDMLKMIEAIMPS